METIYLIIKQNPEYFAWIFGLINALWLGFVYFNKKRHQRDLVSLKQALDLDLERRKKVFEVKTSQYEDYFKQVDAIHRRHRNDYQEVLGPIINEFNAAYQKACSVDDTNAATEATIRFSEKVNKLSIDGFDELQVVRSQTNTLRLTASDEVAKLLDELQDLYEGLFQLSMKMVSDMVHITINGDQALAAENQKKLDEMGAITMQKSLALREQMRCDLKEI
ncbi:hypothetical protein [Shewanella algae]|uniref:hypothetical protein n=1 Tax=Shewanella algae TaxID=38313 RepID=UPI0006CF9F76|nr:hypothetical protein [Shewanella algae]PSS72115.1 hypothetical protein AYI88_15205 [Shewanella algae]TVK90699.1 hypothetical protein AYJ01_21795 [Shewanella algae]TVK90705.1 hypothetical protein AYJ01_21780 [Shewanella algae]